MRITHLYKHYLPVPGGVQTVMHTLAKSCAREGHEVRAIVAARGPRSTRRIVDGVEVVGLPSFGELLSLPLAPTFPFAPGREGEILHVHESFPLGTLAALWRVRSRPPRGIVVSWHFDVVRQRALAPFHRALVARLLPHAGAIHVATDLHARTPALAPFASRVRVIPYMIDVERFRRAEGHPLARRIREWAAGAPVALFVGRLVYYKGLDVLMDALRLTRAQVVVAGDGPLAASLRDRTERLGVASRVLWLGSVSEADLPGAYSGADVFVLPSVARTEAFGVAQVEAMAAGLPVVNTLLGTGVERVNVDGGTGRTVPVRDPRALAAAIDGICGDAALRSRFAANAIERSGQFAPERLLDRYLTLYEEAAA